MTAGAEGLQPILEMNAEAIDRDRPADLVVARTPDFLKVARDRNATDNMERVVSLADALLAVRQVPVTEQESKPAELEVARVLVRNCVVDEGAAHLVFGAFPALTGGVDADRGCRIDFGVGEGF